MVASKIGESVEHCGVTYTVGATVTVAKGSDYDGLVGVIKEITTDKDMDTDNDALDIYCDFEEPTDPEVIAKLEKRFSYIYDKPQTMQDICLDGIVMAPDEIFLTDNPPCYQSEANNPYPLCVGNESQECVHCSLYTNLDYTKYE